MPSSKKILVIGAAGQIGTELVMELRKKFGSANVIASDVKVPGYDVMEGGPFEILDVLDARHLFILIKKYKVSDVYQLAALLSATAEQNPSFAWKLNVNGLFHILDLAKEKHISKIFWPSTIAVFGPSTPTNMTPQITITEPTTVYGISKLTGERWCDYYYLKYGVDVRSLRYPGLIGYKSAPGGGTTDYAVHIFQQAIREKRYTCFLKEDAVLPMMYMPDAIRGTIELMDAPAGKIKIRSGYNFAGMSFSPKQLAGEIKKYIPVFECKYNPDFRQKFADAWPKTVDDSIARNDWGWKPAFDLPAMVEDMLKNLQNK